MAKFINTTNVGLATAAWLAYDDYDYVDNPNYISATTLLKPVKQIILASRIPDDKRPELDVLSVMSSRMGTAIHNAIEQVWESDTARDTALKALGVKKRIRDSIVVNPTKEQLAELDEAGDDYIPVYMEQRLTRELMGFTIGGKFDFCAEGVLVDFKSTKTYTYSHQTNADKYPLQGSIYKWLAPDIVDAPYMEIQYLFTDWKAIEAKRDPKNYPPQPAMTQKFTLKSVNDTERWIKDKLIMLKKLHDKPESDMPLCTDDDLWRKPTVWKYYKNPAKATEKGARSTKNFDTQMEANKRYIDDGRVGKVVEVKGTVTACKYCDVCIICEQKDAYLADGSLTL